MGERPEVDRSRASSRRRATMPDQPVPSAGAPLPDFIDDYSVASHIGRGSYGYVYRVTNPRGDEYALKWLRPNADDEFMRRFEIEVWVLQNLDHAAIPRYVTRGEFGGMPYFVMTLAPG